MVMRNEIKWQDDMELKTSALDSDVLPTALCGLAPLKAQNMVYGDKQKLILSYHQNSALLELFIHHFAL